MFLIPVNLVKNLVIKPTYLIELKKYYYLKHDLNQFYCRLKNIRCPHCRKIGYLILHGFLYGYCEKSYHARIKRGRRFFCSNRNRRKGCGRTFSILNARYIKGYSITSKSLSHFLSNIARGLTKPKALSLLYTTFTRSSAYRLYSRFKIGLSHIRALLFSLTGKIKFINAANPVLETIFHLKTAFQENDNFVLAFQLHFQKSFFGHG